MQGKKFIDRIKLKNFLSYQELHDPNDVSEGFKLEPINILIGPNGSGKSNLMEAVSLLKAAPTDFTDPLRRGGGVTEWLWKGQGATSAAEIGVVIPYPQSYFYLDSTRMPLHYKVEFREVNGRTEIENEIIENYKPIGDKAEPYFYYRQQPGSPTFNVLTKSGDPENNRTQRHLQREERENISLGQSVLQQPRDPEIYPEVAFVSEQFSSIRLYRDLNVSRDSVLRKPQQIDVPNKPLEDDNPYNFTMILQRLYNQSKTRQQLIEKIKEFLLSAQNPIFNIEGGIQIFLEESGLSTPVSTARLSDGTLRYLYLLAVLCQPKLPPLICIEEPELGLHPDAIVSVANLLIEASQNTQLIVTTHSDVLISAFDRMPEAIVVCEREDDGTKLSRLQPDRLEKWLENYSLGRLWGMDLLGGRKG